MSNFRLIDRDTGFLMPPLVDDWLPERHLARFVVEVVEGLDVRAMTGSYRGSGEASYHPRLLLGLIIYGYATGVFSSRKLERATYDSVAFRFIAANEHPDHDTIAAFRRRFLRQIETLFVQVLGVAREMGVLKLGTVALDGTKIHANANVVFSFPSSRHGEAFLRRGGSLHCSDSPRTDVFLRFLFEGGLKICTVIRRRGSATNRGVRIRPSFRSRVPDTSGSRRARPQADFHP